MKNNNEIAHQLVHDLEFDLVPSDKIKDYDKKVEIVENLLNKITAPENIIEIYSKLEDDIYDWCQEMIKLVPLTYTDELGKKHSVRDVIFEDAEITEFRDMIRITTSPFRNYNSSSISYLFLPLSLFLQGDKQKAADYLYGAAKEEFDSECEKEKQRIYKNDLAEYNRLKKKLGL